MGDTKDTLKYEYMGLTPEGDRAYRLSFGDEVWGEAYSELRAKDICVCVNDRPQLWEALTLAEEVMVNRQSGFQTDFVQAIKKARAALKIAEDSDAD